MGKISKSDTLDKAQEEKTRDWLNNQPESKHFTVGTWIMSENIRGEIVAESKDGSRLSVEWENDTFSTIDNPRMKYKRWSENASRNSNT